MTNILASIVVAVVTNWQTVAEIRTRPIESAEWASTNAVPCAFQVGQVRAQKILRFEWKGKQIEVIVEDEFVKKLERKVVYEPME